MTCAHAVSACGQIPPFFWGGGGSKNAVQYVNAEQYSQAPEALFSRGGGHGDAGGVCTLCTAIALLLRRPPGRYTRSETAGPDLVVVQLECLLSKVNRSAAQNQLYDMI